MATAEGIATGVSFALTDEQEAALMATRDDAEVRAFVEEVEWVSPRSVETSP